MSDKDDLLELIGERHIHAPPVRPHRRWVPRFFSVQGKAGEIHSAPSPLNYAYFKGDELFAFDTSPRPGHGTHIENIFVGNQSTLPPGGVPTWMFYEWIAPQDREAYGKLVALVGTEFEDDKARNAKAILRIADAGNKFTWPTWLPALSVTINVRFHETCKWEAVLWGWELSS